MRDLMARIRSAHLCLLIVPALVSAQTAPQENRISLEEALARTLAGNPALAAWLERMQGRESVTSTVPQLG